jgi:hypothetical protein
MRIQLYTSICVAYATHMYDLSTSHDFQNLTPLSLSEVGVPATSELFPATSELRAPQPGFQPLLRPVTWSPPALLMECKHTPIQNTGTTTPGENRAEWDGRNLGTKWVMYLVRAHAHFLSFSRDSLLDYYCQVLGGWQSGAPHWLRHDTYIILNGVVVPVDNS